MLLRRKVIKQRSASNLREKREGILKVLQMRELRGVEGDFFQNIENVREKLILNHFSIDP